MKKSILLSVATAAALATFSGVNHADAQNLCGGTANLQTSKDIKNVQNVQSVDQDKLQALLDSYIKEGKIQGQAPNAQAPKKEAAQPAQPQKPAEQAAPKAPQKETAQPKQPAQAPQKEAAQPKQPAQNEQKQAPSNSSVSAFEKEVVELTNAERQKQGLKPLELDEELSNVARTKSQDMKDKGYFDHNSPTYGSPFDMMKQFGISYKTAGENIAMGQKTPQEVVNAWMNSQGHRENIMNPSFTHIGVGYVKDGNYWTQQFIGK
ncbi:CAP domain-containing protein [Bacillus gobiensis]|uniref:CAP domain-containing protein n=1 Tax=Bacillus gobiensis TaxID=1441095 RepID=UPI003D1B7487